MQVDQLQDIKGQGPIDQLLEVQEEICQLPSKDKGQGQIGL